LARRRRIDNTWPVAALTAGMKPDIGSESRFLPTPAFDVPIRVVPIGISLCRLVLKNEWCGYSTVKNSEDMLTRFDRIYKRDRHTDRMTA